MIETLLRPEKIHIADHRCPACGRLLFRAHIPAVAGVYFETRCKCGRMYSIESKENKDVTNQDARPVAIATDTRTNE